jgi:hypothetical protein
MSKFKIGDRVICINANFGANALAHPQYTFPTSEKTYTVRGLHSEGNALLLEEIKNPRINDNAFDNEISFWEWRFVHEGDDGVYEIIERQ